MQQGGISLGRKPLECIGPHYGSPEIAVNAHEVGTKGARKVGHGQTGLWKPAPRRKSRLPGCNPRFSRESKRNPDGLEYRFELSFEQDTGRSGWQGAPQLFVSEHRPGDAAWCRIEESKVNSL